MLNLMIFFFMEGVVEIARSQTEENYIFIFLKEKKNTIFKVFFLGEFTSKFEQG